MPRDAADLDLLAEVLDLILQTADNAGATDEHRALNYLAVRYPPRARAHRRRTRGQRRQRAAVPAVPADRLLAPVRAGAVQRRLVLRMTEGWAPAALAAGAREIQPA